MSEASDASPAPFAKITRPHYARVLPRKRLFRLLDDRRQPLVWVSGPPGAGKTALVSSYLETRSLAHLWYDVDRADADLPTFFHYLGLAAAAGPWRDRSPLPHLTSEYAASATIFARRYFEALAARIEAPFILVLDNYHELPANAPLHAVLRDGIAALPSGVTVIVVSRSKPPAELARLHINERLLRIGWEELRLTLAEVKGIERLIGGRSVRHSSHQELLEETQGWAGGVVLLLQGRPVEAAVPRGAGHQVLFDYFAGEIFAGLDAQTQRVLSASALLGRMPVRSVRELTGVAAAGDMLLQLNQMNYFTLRYEHAEPTYEYHPLFRRFLLARLDQAFAHAELQQLRRAAAVLQDAEGQVEEAADLLMEAGDMPAMVRLVTRHAPAFIAQGRHKIIEDWLARMTAVAPLTDPWLMYWQGICRLPFHPARARGCFERAYEQFRARGDLLGRCRAWCAIVDCLALGWGDLKPLDRWIEEMSELLRETPRLSDVALEEEVACGMFLALMYRQPQHEDLPVWERRARCIVRHCADPQLRMKVASHLLIYYTWWIGDLAKAELLVSTLRARTEQDSACPLTRIVWYAMAAGYHSLSGADEDAIVCVNRGLALAHEAGVHAWDMVLCALGAFASVSLARSAGAADYLRRMEEKLEGCGLMHQAAYYYACALLRTLEGNVSVARESASVAVAMAEGAGARLLAAIWRTGLGTVLLHAGQHTAGLALIHQSRVEAIEMRSRTIEYWACAAEAMHAMNAGDEAACAEHLRRAFSTAASRRLYNLPWWSAAQLARLYAKSLALGICTDYVISAIRKRNLAAPDDGEAADHWPWPFKIHTCGRFGIVKDGEPLRFAGKSPRKPLELLKALIAFGGIEVNQSSLIDALWPDLEGDNAQRAFETALYRLRKLLADDTVVALKAGKLTLDTGRVWVDCCRIERLLQDIDSALTDTARETAALDVLASRLLAAYGGSFLAEESGGWEVARRERLHSRFMNALQGLARRFEARGAWDAAARCYRRGLEIEPLMETLCHRLTLCHERLGQSAPAARSVNRASLSDR